MPQALAHEHSLKDEHAKRTQALEPLERDSGWDEGELPDTYPEGL